MFRYPMLCNTTKIGSLETVDWSGYVVEPKYDGARAIVDVTRDGVRVYSRSGREFTEHLPHIVESFSLLPEGTTLDGEVALVVSSQSLNGDPVPFSNFNKTMRVLGSLPERGRRLQEEEFGRLSFLCFDVLMYCGEDLTSESFIDRRVKLESMDSAEYLEVSPYWSTDGVDLKSLFEEIVRLGGEGVVLKKTSAKYVPGKRPSRNQYKVKVVREADVVITGAKPGTGKYDGLVGSINFGRWTEDGIVYVGRCSGMTDEERRWFTDNLDELVGSVMTISYNEKVGSKEYQSPRHPQFLRLRGDKKAEECTGYEFKNESYGE